MSHEPRVFETVESDKDAYDGAGDADLSLSELSLNEKPIAGPSQPFSLLARPSQVHELTEIEDEGEEQEVEQEQQEDPEVKQRSVARSREERLRQDLFVLQKLNASLSMYTDALNGVETSSDRAAKQLQKTDMLLNKYINILEKSEAVTKLIFDERWQGAEEDEAILEQKRREVEEAERKRAEEQALAERKERERREREEHERREREEKERIEAEKREKLAIRAGYGGVRGVRGTRASAAKARGAAAARASGLPVRGRSMVTPSNTTTGSGGRYSRPASSASVKSSTSTISSRSNVR